MNFHFLLRVGTKTLNQTVNKQKPVEEKLVKGSNKPWSQGSRG